MKNLLAVMRALITQTKVAGRSAEDYRDTLLAHFAALADAQELIVAQAGPVMLRDLLGRSLALFSQQAQIASGPDVPLTPAKVLPLSFVFHELTTNAAKYGSLSTPEGRVEITWEVVAHDGQSSLSLDWVEAGGRPARQPANALRVRLSPDHLQRHQRSGRERGTAVRARWFTGQDRRPTAVRLTRVRRTSSFAPGRGGSSDPCC